MFMWRRWCNVAIMSLGRCSAPVCIGVDCLLLDYEVTTCSEEGGGGETLEVN